METGPELLGHTEVYAYAARLGLSQRTVERYTAAGWIDRPSVPGGGQGRGRAGWWRPEVLAQLDTVRAALQPRAGLAVVLHRLWWDGGRPSLFEMWRRARLLEAVADFLRREEVEGFSEAELADQVIEPLATAWGRDRKWPYRYLMRGEQARLAMASAVVNLNLGLEAMVGWHDPVDTRDMVYPGRGGFTALADVFDQGMGVTRVRARGVAIPGEFAREVTATLPPPRGRVWILAHVAEPMAARVRDRLKEMDALAVRRGTRTLWGDLRDKPAIGGFALAWGAASGAGAKAARPLETAACPACRAPVRYSPDQLLARCRTCGEWMTVGSSESIAPLSD